MVTIGDVLASNRRFREECAALLPIKQADLLEVRAWVREGADLPEGADETAFRVVILEGSVRNLANGFFI